MTNHFGFHGTPETTMKYLDNPVTGRCRLVRPSEIAELLGMKRNTIDIWKTRGNLPKADVVFVSDSGRSAGDLWLIDTILAWAKINRPDLHEHAVRFLTAEVEQAER
jgi:hypothetical protein